MCCTILKIPANFLQFFQVTLGTNKQACSNFKFSNFQSFVLVFSSTGKATATDFIIKSFGHKSLIDFSNPGLKDKHEKESKITLAIALKRYII